MDLYEDEPEDTMDKILTDNLSSSASSGEEFEVDDKEVENSRNFTVSEDYSSSPFATTLLTRFDMNRVHGPRYHLKRASQCVDKQTWSLDEDRSTTLLSELARFMSMQEEDKEELEEAGPKRRRSRRRASLILRFALASIENGITDWSYLLFRYQISSLGCSNPLTTQNELRKLIVDYPRKSEAQYYQLSYEREPQ